jgi:hypothetical protein
MLCAGTVTLQALCQWKTRAMKYAVSTKIKPMICIMVRIQPHPILMSRVQTSV